MQTDLMYVAAAYFIIWLIIFAYLFMMGRKIAKIEKDIKNLEENLK